MRFLADMGISGHTVAWLREQGHDIVHLRELGWQRASDADVMARAVEEGRIVLTMDLDFAYMLSVSKQRTPSVVLFRLRNEHPTVVNARLAKALERCADALESGAIVSVGDHAIRLRRLPI